MDGRDDARRAVREMVDEIGRAADQAVRMMKQAADDLGRWAGPAPGRGHGAPPDTPGAGGPADAIRDLARLRDEGLITEDEFQEKKTQLLERI